MLPRILLLTLSLLVSNTASISHELAGENNVHLIKPNQGPYFTGFNNHKQDEVKKAKANIFLPVSKSNSSIVEEKKMITFKLNKKEPHGYAEKKIKVLDSFHRKNVPNYNSPFTQLAQRMFIELAQDFEKHEPKYGKHLHNYFNTQYTAQIAVGDPKNLFSFILDTGSGTTLLNDKRCTSPGCKKRSQFDSKGSKDFSTYGKLVKISYAKGGVVIELGRDSFYFSELKIPQQEFGVIIKEKGLFKSASYDGILGLSYPSLSDHTKPLFDRIIELKVLPSNMFSLYLGRGHNSHHSKFFLGGYDKKYFYGDLNFHKVVKKTWWTLKLTKVLLNNKDTKLCNKTTDCKIIMDSGSSLISTPPWALSPFLSKVSSYSNCKNIEEFPTITFVIDDKEYNIEPYEYVLAANSKLTYKKHRKQDICTFGISIFDVGKENVWIAGDIFLTKYYSVYDRDKDRVGLALARQDIK